ncbi:MAG: ChaN family lipoprotein [Verrucomicrobia bacterium]|nr:ChaN family lipoprotein [Verrucomicrobiota bacterium]
MVLLLSAAWLALSACAHRPVKPVMLTGVTASSLTRQDADPWRAVMGTRVMYVGELHDDAAHHAFELRLVQALARAKVDFVVGWEMFDRYRQPSLDAWQRGQLTQAQLFQRTGFERSWASYSPWYARILQETRRLRVENLALNAPPALAHKVAQGQALMPEERAALPKGFRVDPGAFRHFVQMMGGTRHPGVTESSLRRFFAAQSLWDQTMASAILEFCQDHPETKVVVLTGRGHVDGGYGIPYFVAQKAPQLPQLILEPVTLRAQRQTSHDAHAD